MNFDTCAVSIVRRARHTSQVGLAGIEPATFRPFVGERATLRHSPLVRVCGPVGMD